ncbi:hypothetical protein EUZ85_12165 [Hahella sp. KA22]|uniref:sensor histidine kinase n=1 Tax=Hahella sp. KA22 TaxID=1628392 RepID=UPI000FDE7B09|nr:ATP-binding protein [Hahella sp. KA22]AZZ91449.1 hypothetical protein ENC22_09605 [Hahella sp. KA22]QAY54818.1 hypothetical protein EUZ85_12165 [Hahella sp. KA22]
MTEGSFYTSLRFRLLFYILLCSSVITLIVTSLQLYLDFRTDVQLIESRFDQVERSYLRPIADAIWNFNYQAAEIHLDAILSLPDMVCAMVRQDQEVLVSRGATPEAERSAIVKSFMLELHRDDRTVILGQLTVCASLEGVYERLFSRVLVILGSQGVKTFLTSAFFLFIAQLLVTRHLAKMARYAKSLSKDGLHQPLLLRRKAAPDELQSLVDAINAMRSNLLQDMERQQGLIRLAQEMAGLDNKRAVLACAAEYLLRKAHPREGARVAAFVPFQGEQGRMRFERLTAMAPLQRGAADFGVEYLDHSPIEDFGGFQWMPEGAGIRISGDAVELSWEEEGRPVFYLGLIGVDTARIQAEQEYELLPTLMQFVLLTLKNVQTTQELEGKVGHKTALLQSAVNELTERNEELKSAQSQLVQAEKMNSLGSLVAGVAHEVNNPNNFIHVSTSNLLKELFDLQILIFELSEGESAVQDEFDQRFLKLYRHLSIITEGSSRIKRLVDSLRDFSRIEGAEQSKARVMSELEGTLRLVQSAHRSDIDFDVDLQADPKILGFPAQLGQVFMNLLINACQAVEEKRADPQAETGYRGRISVSSRIESGALCMVIEDNGPGIPPDRMKHIFDPFYTSKPAGQGTGLGLSISYEIIQAHRGEITCESEPGRGAKFVIRLPVCWD